MHIAYSNKDKMTRRRIHPWLSLLISALLLALSASPSIAAPYLRFERGVHAVRSYAAEICAQRCSSWSVSKCHRIATRNVGCRFVGRLPGEETCRGGISAFLLPETSGGATLGVSGSFKADSCPAELGKPPDDNGRVASESRAAPPV